MGLGNWMSAMKQRTIIVARQDAGQTVGDVVRRHFQKSESGARLLLREHRLWLDGKEIGSLKWRVKTGQRLELRKATKRPSPSSPPRDVKESRKSRNGIRICYADAHIIVVDKPAGLTTVRHRDEAAAFGSRARRFLPATLADLLPSLLPGGGGRIRAVHRLDKETSGLVVLARTAAAERSLGLQFRAHTNERKYSALVRGKAKSERIESFLIADRGDGRRGSVPAGQAAPAGQHAITHVRVVEDLGDFALVECRLETGRTHQVRIHLGERGTPLCGEKVYDRPLHGAPLPDTSGFARPALHAAYLAIDHPGTGKRMSWSSPLPKDMAQLLKRLRK
jgi:23S rRNA pseudouridine1911/1915/1917 synthase